MKIAICPMPPCAGPKKLFAVNFKCNHTVSVCKEHFEKCNNSEELIKFCPECQIIELKKIQLPEVFCTFCIENNVPSVFQVCYNEQEECIPLNSQQARGTLYFCQYHRDKLLFQRDMTDANLNVNESNPNIPAFCKKLSALLRCAFCKESIIAQFPVPLASQCHGSEYLPSCNIEKPKIPIEVLLKNMNKKNKPTQYKCNCDPMIHSKNYVFCHFCNDTRFEQLHCPMPSINSDKCAYCNSTERVISCPKKNCFNESHGGVLACEVCQKMLRLRPEIEFCSLCPSIAKEEMIILYPNLSSHTGSHFFTNICFGEADLINSYTFWISEPTEDFDKLAIANRFKAVGSAITKVDNNSFFISGGQGNIAVEQNLKEANIYNLKINNYTTGLPYVSLVLCLQECKRRYCKVISAPQMSTARYCHQLFHVSDIKTKAHTRSQYTKNFFLIAVGGFESCSSPDESNFFVKCLNSIEILNYELANTFSGLPVWEIIPKNKNFEESKGNENSPNDEKKSHWSKSALKLAKPRANFSGFVRKKLIYVFGGQNEHGMVSGIECIDIFSGKVIEIVDEKNYLMLCDSSIVQYNDNTYYVIGGYKKNPLTLNKSVVIINFINDMLKVSEFPHTLTIGRSNPMTYLKDKLIYVYDGATANEEHTLEIINVDPPSIKMVGEKQSNLNVLKKIKRELRVDFDEMKGFLKGISVEFIPYSYFVAEDEDEVDVDDPDEDQNEFETEMQSKVKKKNWINKILTIFGLIIV